LRATCPKGKLKFNFLSNPKTQNKNKETAKVSKFKNDSSDVITCDCTLMPVAQPFNNTWHISWYPEISVSKILRESYMKGKSMDVNFE